MGIYTNLGKGQKILEVKVQQKYRWVKWRQMSAAIDKSIRSVDSVTSFNMEHEITRLLAYYKNSITR
jgi:hypothetical protein